MKKIFLWREASAIFAICALIYSGGCGYTTKSLLPSHLKTIHINNFKNAIQVTAEQNELRMYRAYHPGMETELTRMVIDRYIMDGNLRIAREGEADLILTGVLVDYRRGPLRYDVNGNIDEYRVEVIVNISLEDVKSGKVMWAEDGFAGESTFRTSGSLAASEEVSLSDAMMDLARRIVERTIEVW